MSRLVQPGLAKSDLDFSAPCQRCAALLHGRVKFCPYCGEDASVTFGADAAEAALEPELETPVNETQEDVSSELARIVPARLGWQEELPAQIAVAPPSGAALKRSATGKVAALVLAVLALALGYLYFDKQNETDRLQEFTAKLAQAQSALSRGDLTAAERALVPLAAAHPDHPDVRALKDELDQRVREQTAKREQLRDATLRAAKALGLSDPAPAPAPDPAPPAAEVPAIAVPAPVSGVTAPQKTECDAALAALALCER
ncbi:MULTISPECIES: hypothetical protein [unclassified Variovorax]|uniref:hypothetical protein n=1 Tax=unclassified Variovorax TaxID=663243 RepID=UPI003ED01632